MAPVSAQVTLAVGDGPGRRLLGEVADSPGIGCSCPRHNGCCFGSVAGGCHVAPGAVAVARVLGNSPREESADYPGRGGVLSDVPRRGPIGSSEIGPGVGDCAVSVSCGVVLRPRSRSRSRPSPPCHNHQSVLDRGGWQKLAETGGRPHTP